MPLLLFLLFLFAIPNSFCLRNLPHYVAFRNTHLLSF